MEQLYIHHQNKQRYFELPPQWRLMTFAAFPDRSGPGDVEARTREVLKSPVGHAPLDQSVSASDKVAILIEDPSRASPKQLVLRALLKELQRIHVPNDQIVIVISLATHRMIPREELGRVYGHDLLEQYEFVNHDCNAPDQVPIGTLKSGTTVKINKRYRIYFSPSVEWIRRGIKNTFPRGGRYKRHPGTSSQVQFQRRISDR